MKKFALFGMMVMTLMFSLVVSASAVGENGLPDVEPQGYSQTTFSATVTSTTRETIKHGIVDNIVNNSNVPVTQTLGGMYTVRNSYGYSDGMGGAGSKAAIEQAVGFDVDMVANKSWQHTVTAGPHKSVSVGINNVYTRKNVKITKKYQVWTGNNINPTTTYTYGTGWARNWYTYDCYLISDDIK